MAPALSIVVGTVDRPRPLGRLVDSILRNTQDVDWELLIGDASQAPTRGFGDSRITIIEEKPQLGHAAGYNKLFLECRGRWVVWLNDDCEVQPQWASAAIEFMNKNLWVGLGCLYYSESGCCWHINTYQGMIYANFGIVERDFGDQLGWFDEDLVYCYGADNSIAFKTILAGRGIAGIPRSKIAHKPVMDYNKMQNVNRQAEDAARLMAHYRPHVDQMLKLYIPYPKSQLTVHD